MIDPTLVRERVELVRAGLSSRGLDPDKALEEVATLETARRRISPELEGLKRQQNASGDEIAFPELEGLKRQQNASGDEIARAKRQGRDTAPIQEANRARAAQIKQLDVQLDSIEHRR